MSTIDFNKPATTDLYTAWPTSIQGNQQSLGFGLDPTYVTAYTNLVTGMKRINSATGLIEQWSGTAWAAMSTGYLLDAGDTMTGVLTTNNNVAHSWKDSGGTVRTVLFLNSSNNIVLGDLGNAIAGSQTNLYANSSVGFIINGTNNANLSATGWSLASGCIISTANTEGLRTRSDTGFISFYNTAGTTRNGYLQGNTSASLLLMAENGNNLLLGTNGATRMTITPSGNVGIAQAPSTWGSSYRGLEMVAPGNGLMANSSTIYVVNNVSYDGTNWRLGQTAAASIYLQAGGAHQWYTLASGTAGAVASPVPVVAIDTNGNFLVGTGTATSNSSGRGLLEINGSSNALLALDIGGARKAYVYHNGTDFILSADSGQAVIGTAGGSMSVQTNGASKFAGGAFTTPNKPGSVSGAVSLDSTKSNVHEITLGGNMTSISLNMSDGQTVNVFITQDGTGSRTATWGSSFKWPGGTAGVLSTAANSVDLLVVTYRATTGFFYATLAKAFA